MRLADFILQKRYHILTAIALITLFLGFFSLRIDLNQNPDELLFKQDPEYPLLRTFFQDFGYDEMVVAAYATDDVLQEEELKSIEGITEDISELEGVTKVLSPTNAVDIFNQNGQLVLKKLVEEIPTTQEQRESLRERLEQNPFYSDILVSRDGRIAMFDITLDPNLSNQSRNQLLEDIDRSFQGHNGSGKHYLAGSPVGRAEFFRCIRRDFSTLLPIGMVLLIISMYLIFRNYLSVLLPFLAVCLSVVWTVGSMYLVGSELNFLSVLIPTILLIIGTSDCIHILSHYQDCRYTCSRKREALRRTISEMSFPCLLTTLTTIVGFSSLAVCRIVPLKVFGAFCAVGIGFAFALSITVLPIGLSLADTRPLSLPKPPSDILLGFLTRVSRLVHSRKRLTLILSGIIFALSFYGSTKLRVETDPGKFFGDKIRVVSDMLFIEQNVGGFIPLYVLLDGGQQDALKEPETLRKIDQVAAFVRKQEGVDKVVSLSDLVKYLNYRLNDDNPENYRIPDTKKEISELLFLASISGHSDLVSAVVNETFSRSPITIRFRHHDFYSFDRLATSMRPVLKSSFGEGSEISYHLTGTNVMLANTLVPILDGLKQSLGLAAIAVFTLIAILFRSIRLAIISIIPNLLPIVMTLGLMGLLGISLNFGTAPIAAIALGLAIDDTIHFLSRLRTEYSRDGDYEKAVARCIMSVGKPILSTSIVLSCGFFIFLFSNFHFTQNMGILISLTVLAAVIGDLVLLPVLILVLKPLGKVRNSGVPGMAGS